MTEMDILIACVRAVKKGQNIVFYTAKLSRAIAQCAYMHQSFNNSMIPSKRVLHGIWDVQNDVGKTISMLVTSDENKIRGLERGFLAFVDEGLDLSVLSTKAGNVVIWP